MIVFVSADYLQLDKGWIIGGLLGLGWLFFTGLANDIVERVSGSSRESEVDLGKKCELISFNDAVANELMKIRSDLIAIKIKQNNNNGWDNISSDFMQLYLTYNAYPSCFLCTYLETPEDYSEADKYQGMIIIVLAGDINLDDFWEVKFDADILRQLNSYRRSKITTGKKLSVFICEDKRDRSCTSERSAKVLSIEETRHGESVLVTLEIDLDTVWDDLYWRPEESKGKYKIIRKIEISTYPPVRHNCEFVADKESPKESTILTTD